MSFNGSLARLAITTSNANGSGDALVAWGAGHSLNAYMDIFSSLPPAARSSIACTTSLRFLVSSSSVFVAAVVAAGVSAAASAASAAATRADAAETVSFFVLPRLLLLPTRDNSRRTVQ